MLRWFLALAPVAWLMLSANNLTDYLENKLLDHSLGKTSFTMPATVRVVLFTADPTESGSFADEVAAGVGYARQALTIDAAAAGATQNDATITFGPATGSPWGTVTHVGIADSATIGAGNLLWYGALSVSKVVGVGDSLDFDAGDLDFSMN